MKTKALKLPDGGTFQLQTPPEFGAPILALNGAGSFGATDPHRNPVVVYGIGIALGITLAYLWLHTGEAKA